MYVMNENHNVCTYMYIATHLMESEKSQQDNTTKFHITIEYNLNYFECNISLTS